MSAARSASQMVVIGRWRLVAVPMRRGRYATRGSYSGIGPVHSWRRRRATVVSMRRWRMMMRWSAGVSIGAGRRATAAAKVGMTVELTTLVESGRRGRVDLGGLESILTMIIGSIGSLT